jgi:cytochrome o ubiquinol oxidase subunit 1
VIFAAFAGVEYWFPKAFGFRLDERWGKAAFWFAFLGFWVTFAPLYFLGLQGMTRRLQHIDIVEWRPSLYLAAVGIVLLAIGMVCQLWQFVVSIRHRDALRDVTGDPWDGRSLEWATPSPPPSFNFAITPNVKGEEAYWFIKQRAILQQALAPAPRYQPIHLPRNSPTGFVTAFFASLAGFALIWHIWWLLVLCLVGAYGVFVIYAWRDITEYEIPAEEVARIDGARRDARTAWLEAHGGLA